MWSALFALLFNPPCELLSIEDWFSNGTLEACVLPLLLLFLLNVAASYATTAACKPNACLSVELREGEGEGGRAAIDRLLTSATMNSNSLSLLLARERERGSAHPRHYVHYMLESHAQKCAAQKCVLLR